MNDLGDALMRGVLIEIALILGAAACIGGAVTGIVVWWLLS